MKNLAISAQVSVESQKAVKCEFRIHDGRLFWHGCPKRFAQAEHDRYCWPKNACIGEATVLSEETIQAALTTFMGETPWTATFEPIREVNERKGRDKQTKDETNEEKKEVAPKKERKPRETKKETEPAPMNEDEPKPMETEKEVAPEVVVETEPEPQPMTKVEDEETERVEKNETKKDSTNIFETMTEDEELAYAREAWNDMFAALMKGRNRKPILDTDEIVALIDSRIKATVNGQTVRHEHVFMNEETNEEHVVEGKMCREFASMVETVRRGFPLYMNGPAGTGKSFTAKKIAEALGLDYYESMQVMFAHDVKGYGDAAGNYQATPFFKAFTKGGIFFLDEVDASAPEALVVLNTAIANRRFDFPIVGNVEAHPDFRVIAAGNTSMTGADTEYTGRSVIDASTINRFFFVYMDYDHDIETHVAGGDETIANYLDDLRESAKESRISLTVSYRQAETMGDPIMQKAWGDVALLANGVFKGLQKDEIRILYGGLKNQTGRWAAAHASLI